jgi:heterodisulfide reductase subunit B
LKNNSVLLAQINQYVSKKMGEMLQLSSTKTHLANIIKSTTNIEKLKEKYSSITRDGEAAIRMLLIKHNHWYSLK